MDDFLPLKGVRVLDFSHVIAGPLATFYLSRMGATVVKVENRDGGDVMRRGKGLEAFVALNAGKDSLQLDLQDPADRAKAIELAREFDVVVDSLRPGVLDRRGLGAEALQTINPGLIYCSISGFGRQGPWDGRPAYDHVVQAATGMTLMAGNEGDGPIKTGFPVVDAATGILAALAILAALRERDTTGRGRYLDVAMTAAALQLMYPMSCDALTHGKSPARVGNQGYSGSPAADLFEAKDGWIALGANTPRQFIALLGVLDRVAVASDPSLFEKPLSGDGPAQFLGSKDPVRLKATLTDTIKTWSAMDLEKACAKANVPAARVRTIGEFATEVQENDGLGSFEMVDGETRITSPGLGFRVR